LRTHKNTAAEYICGCVLFWFTKSTPGSAGGQKEAYGEGKSRQEKVSELE